MAYQSFFSSSSGGSTATAPKAGGGYQSFFGNTVAKTGSIAANQVAQPKVQIQKVAPAPKSTSLFSKVTNFAKNDIVKPVVDTGVKSAKTVEAGTAGLVGLGTAGVQALKGNKAGADRTLTGTEQEINQNLKGSYLTPAQAKKGGTSLIKPAAQAVTDILPLVAPMGEAAKGASLAAKVARGAVTNATLAAGTTIPNEAIQGRLKTDNGGELIKGVASAAALGAAGSLIHAGVYEVTTSIKDAKTTLTNAKVNSLLDKVRPPETAPKPVTKIPVNSIPEAELAKVDPAKLAAESQAKAEATIQPPAKPSAVPSANDNAVSTIQQHMADNYTPASSHPDETFAADHLQNNTDKALKAYQARTTKVFGSKNIVGGDDAKYAVPGMDASKSVNYHEPSSEFAKGYYKHLLTDPDTTHKPVMITAGGTGAGKTSALKKYFVDNGGDVNDYAAIVDTNLTTLKSATERIEPALATGHDVHVNFVYRDPTEAFENGVIPRAAKEGRAVTAGTHAETHAGSLAAIKEIADKYKDNPKVHIEIHDNSRGARNSKVVNLDFLKDKSYTKSEIEAKIHSLLDTQLQEGKLTNEQHTIFKGEDKPVTAKPSSTTAEAPQSVGKTRDDVSRVGAQRSPETERQPQQERSSGGVKEQGTTLYRGGKDFNTSLSTHRHIAEDFAKNRGGVVSEHVLKPDAKIVNYDDVPNIEHKGINDYNVQNYAGGESKDKILPFMEGKLEQDYAKAAKWAKDNGYDAIKYSTEGEVRLLNKDALKSNVSEQKANTDTTGKSLLSKTKSEPKTLTPVQTSHMPEIGGYTHSTHMAQDYADMLRGQEQQVRGGLLVDDHANGKTRISEHSKFYRDFYAENKKAPTKSDYLHQAKLELAAGKDGLGAGEDYKALLDREAKPIPTPQVSSPLLKTDGKTKTSKLASGVEKQAITAKLTKSLGDLPQYSKMNMKEQAGHAIDLLQNDQQKAVDIALGKEAPPAHILPEAVYTAVENHALVTHDVDLLRALANSHLVSEATAMGQRIRALGERDSNSPVAAIKAVQDARVKAFEAKGKVSAAKAVTKEVQAIRAAKPKITKETFSSFVDTLRC